MGQYRISDDVRSSFAEPLSELALAFQETCDQWQRAYRAGHITQEELYLNTSTATRGLGALRKLHREISGKLEDAIAGVYQYPRRERSYTLNTRE